MSSSHTLPQKDVRRLHPTTTLSQTKHLPSQKSTTLLPYDPSQRSKRRTKSSQMTSFHGARCPSPNSTYFNAWKKPDGQKITSSPSPHFISTSNTTQSVRNQMATPSSSPTKP